MWSLPLPCTRRSPSLFREAALPFACCCSCYIERWRLLAVAAEKPAPRERLELARVQEGGVTSVPAPLVTGATAAATSCAAEQRGGQQ